MFKEKKQTLGFKLSIVIMSVMIIIGILLVSLSYRIFWNNYTNFYSEKAQNISQMAAGIIDGDKISYYVETGKKDAYYMELEKTFSDIKEKVDLAYLYIYYPEEDHFVYILDAATKEDATHDISALGDIYEYGETELTYLLPDIKAKRASTELILGEDVGYGKSVSAWAPVFNSEGDLVAMVEADYYLDKVEDVVNRYEFAVAGIILCGLLVMLGIMLYMIRYLVSKPLNILTSVVSSYQNGKYAKELLPIKTNDEIQILSESFSDMMDRIESYIINIQKVTAEKERIGAELNIATQIQADMLPRIFPPFPNRREFDIYATMTPAKEVGGDFYDFFLVDEDHLAIVMADVSGKGVPAALFMVIAKTLIKNHAQQGESLEDVFNNVNAQLCEGNDTGFFVTAWLGVLEVSTSVFTYVNAGHNPPLYRKNGGEFEWLKSKPGFVLAGMPGMQYKQASMKFEIGDMIYLYTDGVTEAINDKGEFYGDDRLKTIMNSMGKISLQEILKCVKDDMDDFVGDANQFDDITMLVMEYNQC